MNPHLNQFICAQNAALFQRITESIQRLPEIDLGRDQKGRPIHLSCHLLARAVARIHKLRVVDGRFLGVFSHSWVYSPDFRAIFDVYPVGMLVSPQGGALLVDNVGGLSPGFRLYQRSRNLTKEVLFSSKEFRHALRLLTRALRAVTLLSPTDE